MRRTTIIICTAALLLILAGVFWPPTIMAGTYSGGSGTSGDPYRIATAANWTELTSTSADWNKQFILTADINFGGATLAKVGDSSTNFTGVFNGNGHVLSNASIGGTSSSYVGVFGFVGSSGEIRNLGIEDIEITGEYDTGGLAGDNAGTITDCYATGAVSASSSDMGWDIGGLVGYNTGTITDCYATGQVTVSSGYYFMEETGEIGGLVGYNYGGTITGCYATGAVTVSSDVEGGFDIGGLVGYSYTGTITNCYATGAVSGYYRVGGLVGELYSATLTNCYATGAVTANYYASGLVGNSHSSTVTNCYATGAVTGSYYAGGLVGYVGSSTFTSCYWDTQTSGQSSSAAGEGRTTDEMTYEYAANTYVDWNFTTIWAADAGYQNNGYPYLQWQSLEVQQYTLTYTAGSHGSISGTSPQTVDYGGNGTAVTAVPDTGYHFVEWSDDSTDNPRTDTNVTADITVDASFAINTYTLTYTAGAHGSITGNSSQTVDYGGNGTAVTAVPDTGYHFVSWSDDSTDNPRTDTNVTADISIEASFAIDTFTYQWHTFYGSAVDDRAYTVALDSSGNIYVTGRSKDTWTGPAGQLPLHAHSDPGTAADVFVLKLDRSGSYLWHTFYGTSGTADSVDYGYGVVADDSNVYVTGFSYGPWDGPAGQPPKHAYSGERDYHSDILVLKLDKDGNYQWHTFYGSNADADPDGQSEEGHGIVLDGSNVYVAGISYNTWQGDNDTNPLHAYSGGWDIVVLKLDKDGNYQWHTFYGSADSDDEGFAIARDASSNLFITGHSYGTWQGDSDTNPLHAYSGGSDIVVLKLDSNGAYQRHTFYGSATGGEECRGIAVDGSGNVFVTGNSNVSWQGDDGADPLHPFAGNADITVLKLNNSGAYQWHTFYGSSAGDDYGLAIGIDGSSNAYVVGRSNQSWKGDGNLNPLHAYSGGADIIMLQLTGSGTYGWHTFYGSSGGDDYGQDIAVDACGAFYVAGYSPANWLGDGGSSPLHAYTGSQDIYVLANTSTTCELLTTSSGAGGNVTAPGEGTYIYDTSQVVNIAATADSCYHFVNWTGDTGTMADVNAASTTITMSRSASITANFATDSYTLTYTAGANGSISGNGSQTVNCGDSGTAVTAVSYTGYHFVEWSDDSTDNPRTDTNVTGNITVEASFAINTYTLTYTAGAHGSITGNSSQTVNYGGNGSAVTAVPGTGYHFVKWSDDYTDNPRTDTGVTGNITVEASFVINTYTLTYTAGAHGSISGNSSQTVDYGGNGSAVTAVPGTGYHFVKWSDDSTDNPRTDTNVTSNISVTASFAINTYTLTYTAGAHGSISGTSPQTVSYGGSGTAVTAVPNTGYHFLKWSDDSTANPRTDTDVTANLSVTASFAINTYTLTYTAGAHGSIMGTSPQTVSYGGSGTAVTAVPGTGYHFVKWSDNVMTASRTDTNVTANLSVTASFAINTYTLTYTSGSHGSISGTSPQTVSYGGSSTAVTAVPDTGYHFVKWSDNVMTASRTDTNVTSNISVTASFAITTYTLTYIAGDHGSISGTNPQTVSYGGSGSAVTAVPDTGYHFVKWSDDSTDNSRTDTNVTANISVTASFAINTYTLAYNADDHGSISGTNPQTVSYGGSGSAVTAVPDTGYHFVKWSDDSTDNSRTDTNVTADITVEASFAINTFTLTYTAGAHGSISGTSPQTVSYGGSGTAVTAVPGTGYHFVKWSDDSTDNPRTDANITADITVEASFAINTFTLTYTAGAHGSISGNSSQTVDYGGSGTAVTAVPDTGYHFVKWSDDSTDNPRTDTNVTADITVEASFAINTYTLTYTAATHGSISSNSSQTVSYGGNGTAVTAVPDTGYHFVNWSDDSTANPRTDTNVTADISVTAIFTINSVVSGGLLAPITPKLEVNMMGDETSAGITTGGVLTETVNITSEDGEIELELAKDTKALDSYGNPLSEIAIEVATEVPDPPENAHIVGFVISGEPSGATFEPPITLTIHYDPTALAPVIDENELQIAYWNGTQWVLLPSIVDTTTHTVSASISHFTDFAVMASLSEATPMATPTPASTPTPTPTPALTPEPTATPAPTPTPVPVPTTTSLNVWLIVGIIVALIILGLAIWYLVSHRRR